MSGFQFAHLEGYARVGSVQKVKETIKVIDPETGKTVTKLTGNVRVEKTKSMVDIVDEAERVAGAIPHIDNPENPVLLYGVMPRDVLPMAEAWALQATDSKGRKLRKDGQCLLAGVLSLPREREDDFEAFAEACIKWLKEKYGARLKSVISHDDEDHPHLHFYVVPEFGEDFASIHEGFKASKEAKAEGKLKGEQNQAYNKAMRAFQDGFHQQVAMHFGLTRLGPGRRRLTRDAWQAEQATARANAEALKAIEKAKSKAIALAKEKAIDAYNKAQARGYNDGMQQAQAESIETGARLGNVLTGVLGGLHQPTSQAMQAVRDAEARAEDEKKKREQAELEAKQEADKRVTKIAQELQQIKGNHIALNEEIQRVQEMVETQGLIIAWYVDQFGQHPPDLTKK